MKLSAFSLLLALVAPLTAATSTTSTNNTGCKASPSVSEFCAKFSAYGRFFRF